MISICLGVFPLIQADGVDITSWELAVKHCGKVFSKKHARPWRTIKFAPLLSQNLSKNNFEKLMKLFLFLSLLPVRRKGTPQTTLKSWMLSDHKAMSSNA